MATMTQTQLDPSKLVPCGYCRRCEIHDDPGGCLTVSQYVREHTLVPTERFTWLPAEDLFVADASDLSDVDTRDGFTLVSGRTGAELTFISSDWKFGEDGLLWIDYAPISGDFNCRVRLYND